jgi:hypothetical protein
VASKPVRTQRRLTHKQLIAGEYTIRVTLQHHTRVDADDDSTEDELLLECRRTGEMVDWEVQRD